MEAVHNGTFIKKERLTGGIHSLALLPHLPEIAPLLTVSREQSIF